MATMQDMDLPKGLHQKHGRYYAVKWDGATKKTTWIGLSRKLDEAVAQHRLINAGKTLEAFDTYGAPSHWLSNVSKALHEQSKKRAREADILYTLTVEDVFDIGMASNWRCAVTGMKFKQDQIEGSLMRPFMPSIDRIVCSRGYTRENCRMVCVVTNFALNNWGEMVLRELAMAYAKHHKLNIS